MEESEPDRELLRRYVAAGDRLALDVLIRRYLDFVHAVAQRQLGSDAHGADDVTQAVFLLLARKAASVPAGRIGGWLFRATRFAATDVRKLAARRARHERQAAIERRSHFLSR